MRLRIAINGFGRIGRMVFRRMLNYPSLEVVAINASYPASTLAHLIKYDTTHGTLADHTVTCTNDTINIDDHEIKLISNRDPAQLPWRELDIDVVIESTGKFCDPTGARLHLLAGSKKVVITAPAKGDADYLTTIVMGVNQQVYIPDQHHIISNSSCTTNCLAPMIKVLDENYGLRNGLITTVHAYTNDQNNLDNPHKDLRRARACAHSIIPAQTGAARSIGVVLPRLLGKLNGLSLRVPTSNVSVVDLVADFENSLTVEDVNETFKNASRSAGWQGILGYVDDPLVSSDFNGSHYSTIFDSTLTMTMGKRKLKVMAWYDNEWGYACRVVDLTEYVGTSILEQIHT